MTDALYAKNIVKSFFEDTTVYVDRCSIDGCDTQFVGVTLTEYAEHLAAEHADEFSQFSPTDGVAIQIVHTVERARNETSASPIPQRESGE